MKLTSLLSTLCSAALVALVAGIFFPAAAFPLFASGAGLFLLLIGATDYAVGPRFAGSTAAAGRRESHPLAA